MAMFLSFIHSDYLSDDLLFDLRLLRRGAFRLLGFRLRSELLDLFDLDVFAVGASIILSENVA